MVYGLGFGVKGLGIARSLAGSGPGGVWFRPLQDQRVYGLGSGVKDLNIARSSAGSGPGGLELRPVQDQLILSV
jgi:hypothetical protein